jgi:hypothetical protein
MALLHRSMLNAWPPLPPVWMSIFDWGSDAFFSDPAVDLLEVSVVHTDPHHA